MRLAILAGLAATWLAVPAHGDALRRTVAPMTRADGAVCDLLKSDLGDTCKRIARDGHAAVYQSRSRSARGSGGSTGIRRFVLALDTGSGILVGPTVDVLDDQLESARPTLRAIAIDGHPGVALDVVSTWRRGKTAEHAESLIGCMQAGSIWKCSLIDVGGCDASLTADGTVTTSCGATASLAVGS
ncbi:MAG: hypothetical protein E6J90_27380 [Deltaproteobacteria bacterium]|nr:MAG: hypothetical protein E6J90_27380 [Deltaproteobacteria bacterium]TMQ17629.1 MAG: hypothetical protein E6J91_09640 [Deltaproteobacteria bacterium]